MVLAAIEVVVQVVASAVLEEDSVEVLEEEASQAAGNPCKNRILIPVSGPTSQVPEEIYP